MAMFHQVILFPEEHDFFPYYINPFGCVYKQLAVKHYT